MNLPEELEKALTLLDLKLSKKNLKFEMTVLGSMALYLNGYSLITRRTDLDLYEEKISPEIRDLISEVTTEMGLDSDWINNNASSIYPLPQDYRSRLVTISTYKNIRLFVLSPIDLIFLKVNAIYIRDSAKDVLDLKSLNPTNPQLDQALEYVRYFIRTHHGESEVVKAKDQLLHFRKDFDEKLK